MALGSQTLFLIGKCGQTSLDIALIHDSIIVEMLLSSAILNLVFQSPEFCRTLRFHTSTRSGCFEQTTAGAVHLNSLLCYYNYM